MFQSSSLGFAEHHEPECNGNLSGVLELTSVVKRRHDDRKFALVAAADGSSTTLPFADTKTLTASLPRHATHTVPIGTRRSSRTLDVGMAIASILVFLPLMLLIAAAIRLSTAGPVLYSQERLGEGGRRFRCLKFRTMRIDADLVLANLLADPVARAEWERDHKMRNDPRVTFIGRLLRKTSLDELPQLFNVLAGHMSVVGPRPIVDAEVGRYGSYIRAYYSVRPGMTGLWQVSGRNQTSYRRRVACDVTYARSRSARGDLAIIARTIPAVLMARGAY